MFNVTFDLQIGQLEFDLSAVREKDTRAVANRNMDLDEVGSARDHCLEVDKKIEDLEKRLKQEKELSQATRCCTVKFVL